MTRPRPFHQTTGMGPICTVMIACDGANLAPQCRERGYCGKCHAAMKKKAQGPKTALLRGENSALPASARKGEGR